MIFARFFTVFLLALCATYAMAADRPPSAGATVTTPCSDAQASPSIAKNDDKLGAGDASGRLPTYLDYVGPVIATSKSDVSDRRPSPRLKSRSLADLDGNVCYTMRVYKVKPTERLKDGESASRGYSECEMASSYEIRSAEAHDEQPPANLK